MLRIDHVTKRYGPRTVLPGTSITVNAGEAYGVVGPNGSGKSTLLRIAAGDLVADSGHVEVTPGHRVVFLRQAVEAPAGATAGSRFPSLFPDAAGLALTALGERLASASTEVANTLADEYDALLEAIAASSQGAETLRALGLGDLAPGTLFEQLSGGEQAKLALAEAMNVPADVLLLDEPTNHLDLTGIRWLEDQLAAFPGAVLVVSHDRALLDSVVDGLLRPRCGRRAIRGLRG
jgi:ABC transport system ATP-binding/permease protein